MNPSRDPAQEPTLAELIRQRMVALGLTYEKVEERAAAAGEHVSASTVWQLATQPPKRTPKREVLEGLAAGLDVPLEELWAAVLRALGLSVTRLVIDGEVILYVRRLDGEERDQERSSA
jgi:transcriptional regulator with XRE-family HTH domain